MLGECHISFFILSSLYFYLTLSILGRYSDLGVSANLHISFYPPYNVDTQYSKDIINSAIDEGKLVATLGATLDNIIRETSIAPLMSSLGILDKEDMAELVESLISITHLNRRITMSEEGVGGPIDVAIISKGDGFVWKKRKHYFKPELNQMFFDNYFRS